MPLNGEISSRTKSQNKTIFLTFVKILKNLDNKIHLNFANVNIDIIYPVAQGNSRPKILYNITVY